MSVQPLLLALSLLTQLPVARWLNPETITPDTRAGSVHWYLPVAALIGGILASVQGLVLNQLPASLAAAVILLAWVLVTGALHLDGLADCADAAAAHHGDRERTLSVFKSPTVGAMAVVAVNLLLLLKFALLHTLMSQQTSLWVLPAAALIGRGAAVIYMLTTAYAREQGLAINLLSSGKAATGRNTLIALQIIGWLCLLAWLLPWRPLLLALVLCAVFVFSWRRFWLVRINGYVGDCLGATIEITEVLVLVAIVVGQSPVALLER